MKGFDLNLLGALHALLAERNVTRAADRLCVTQPTMSGMLQRLRFQFGDQLLIRHGRNMELTPFAESLQEHVHDAIRSVDALIRAEPQFDPHTTTRNFRIMASDYCTAIFVSRVVAKLAKIAPSVSLAIMPLISPIDRLIAGGVDLCISTDDLSLFGRDIGEDKLQVQHLFSDKFVCVVAEDHPLQEGATLAEYLSYPHVGVQLEGIPCTVEAACMREFAPQFRPNYTVADFGMVALLVARTNFVGIVQKRLSDDVRHYLPVRTITPPFAMPRLEETLLWHRRHIGDPAHDWLRGVIGGVAAEMDPAEEPQIIQ